jgi:hypothetical protein
MKLKSVYLWNTSLLSLLLAEFILIVKSFISQNGLTLFSIQIDASMYVLLANLSLLKSEHVSKLQSTLFPAEAKPWVGWSSLCFEWLKCLSSGKGPGAFWKDEGLVWKEEPERSH